MRIDEFTEMVKIFSDDYRNRLLHHDALFYELSDVLIKRRAFHQIDGRREQLYEYYNAFKEICSDAATIIRVNDHYVDEIEKVITDGHRVIDVDDYYQNNDGSPIDLSEMIVKAFFFYYIFVKKSDADESVEAIKNLFETHAFLNRAEIYDSVEESLMKYLHELYEQNSNQPA